MGGSLRTELVQHIYSPMTQRVPFFNLLASSVDSEYSDEFLAKITTLFEYKTYTPGQLVRAKTRLLASCPRLLLQPPPRRPCLPAALVLCGLCCRREGSQGSCEVTKDSGLRGREAGGQVTKCGRWSST